MKHHISVDSRRSISRLTSVANLASVRAKRYSLSKAGLYSAIRRRAYRSLAALRSAAKSGLSICEKEYVQHGITHASYLLSVQNSTVLPYTAGTSLKLWKYSPACPNLLSNETKSLSRFQTRAE